MNTSHATGLTFLFEKHSFLDIFNILFRFSGDDFEEVNEFEEGDWEEDEEDDDEEQDSYLLEEGEEADSNERDDDFNDDFDAADDLSSEEPFPSATPPIADDGSFENEPIGTGHQFQEENIESLIDEGAIHTEEDYFSNDF